MSVVLAFDCAITGLGAALLRDDAVLAVHREEGRDQAARLLPVIAELLETAKVDRRAVSLIAVTVGPGSFTGVRVGLATARGLALALDVPLAGIRTTDVLLAQANAGDRLVVAAVDTHLGDWFCALREADQVPFLASTEQLASRLQGRPCLVIGLEAVRLATELGEAGIDATPQATLLDPVVLAHLATVTDVQDWDRRNKAEGLPHPLYLRGVNITLPSGERRTVD
ncbi:tRNA threonylcarbamoyladenosine biosynthesis protein TsaB [Enhydrobacter aerosaccus]|uniref:tRNA threonylcarbamoyladenosine biosynthesis protein TsaB n=1 Tax=Enhydrobacter aerosaccus TaxID=225324 RepID=A0A1T4R517_9HYPH|nr:tRNA (adenosine(37)-N6)-threonylcarbamoyltransferase complex dimerization subunit type 1 TsaB [Enhydrobacter aerosaccus]SKA10758.1 tRNA threonylcarbamoyladenosine biosynthesis protein TsaB [Enhydrobacter aerosaccus]